MVDLNPSSDGQLTDPGGHRWTIRRRRLDIRTVRNLLRRPELPVLIDQTGGGTCTWLPEAGREAFRAQLRRSYGLPLNASQAPIQYVGHELVDEHGALLLYFETWC